MNSFHRFLGRAAVTLALAVSPGLALAQQVLNIAVAADVQSWDAQATNATQQTLILRAVFDSPLTQGTDLKLEPRQITAWEWVGDDGLALRVTLRDDIRFSNGDRLTTEDLRFSYIERLRADNTMRFAGMFNRYLDDIEIVSDTVAVFRLKAPMPTLPAWLGFLGAFITPKAYFTEVGREGFIAKPVGAGPYKLVDYQQGSRIVLEPNEHYWGPKPKVERLIFSIIREPSARVAAIESGQVDLAIGLPIREAQRLGQTAGLVSAIEPTTEVLNLAPRQVGVFLNKDVRLAAYLAIDKQALSRAFFGGLAQPVEAFGLPGMPGYPTGFSMPHDVEKAKALMAAAGFSPAKPAELTLLTTNGAFPNDFEVARAIGGMWAQVGIKANIEVVDLAKFYELTRSDTPPEAQIQVYANGTNDPELYLGNALNPDSRFAYWRSEDMRALLGPLYVETDNAKRIEGYVKANTYAQENAYIMPLLQAVLPIVRKADLNFTWYANTWFRPEEISFGAN